MVFGTNIGVFRTTTVVFVQIQPYWTKTVIFGTNIVVFGFLKNGIGDKYSDI